MTAPSVVLFDLDDTLFAHSRAVARGVAAYRAAHGGALAAADETVELERWTALEEHHYHRYLAGELDYREQRRHRARGFVEPYGIDLAADADADEWFGRYLVEYERAWVLYDDTLPCLDALEAGIPGVRFGVITNGELPFQQVKLDATGLAARIEQTFASGQLGFAKPDARIFHHACAALGVDPADAVYVGDRFETDAMGAASAGLRGVWLDRKSAATADELARAAASGVLVIHDLDTLPTALLIQA
ncbi:putative hydrolase of the HAD superfamily [Conyzicola lurida]|uniref:Putative hydrolase of the HAD superfamily n=1 Tax=Conyzicola lurida TaxID=1172621 RepID=A0A841AQR1_9MICO|nr:putative hydrolase of the HAD superfamily [Conyzicola lurida]